MIRTLLTAIFATVLFTLNMSAGDCLLDVEIVSAPDCGGVFAFEAYNYPDGAQVFWTIGNDLGGDGNYFEYEITEPGSYQICVGYETPECPEGVFWCETFLVEDCSGGCPSIEDFWVEYQPEPCGCIHVGLWEADPNSWTAWYFNDNDVFETESNGYVEYCFEGNGYYEIVAVHNSPNCQFEEYVIQVEIGCFDECSLNVEIVQAWDCGGTFELEAYNYPENAVIYWTINDEVVDDDNYLNVELLELGSYQICAAYETPECPFGVFWCETFTVEECNGDCPDGTWMGPIGECGCYGFEVGPNQDGSVVYWEFGDGSYAEGGNYVEHCYETNGVYTVYAYYTSPLCEGVELLIGEVEIGCSLECDLDVTIDSAPDCGGMFVLQAFNYPANANVHWTVNGDLVDDDSLLEIELSEPGSYQICASYETPACPDGITWCETFFVEECNGDCPQEYGYGAGIECGCVGIEIGSFVEGENVIWDYGDGSMSEGGHFTEHCYTSNGVYEVIAIYNSPLCQNQTYVIEVVVDCFSECTEVGFGLDSNVNEGGPPVVDWLVSEYDGMGIADGFCQYNAENLYCDFGLCLEDGCYTLELWGDQVVYNCAFDIFINGGDGSVEVIEDAADGENYLWIQFSVNGGCGEQDCVLNATYNQLDDDSFVFSAETDPIGTVVWDFGDGVTEEAYVADHTFEPGMYIVCATFYSDLCPDGISECFEIYVEGAYDCPETIWMEELSECGCYAFEIGPWTESENVVWDFGNGVVQEGIHYVEYCYPYDGEYIVTAYYTSETCEGVLYTLGEAVVNCSEECTEFVMNFDSYVEETGPSVIEWVVSDMNEETLESGVCQYSFEDPWCDVWLCMEDGCYYFELWGEGIQMNSTAFFWDVAPDNDDIYVEVIPTSDPNYILGVLSVNSNCSEENECPMDYGYVAYNEYCGCFGFEIGSYEEGAEVLWDWGDGSQTEGGHFAEHCYEVDGVFVVTAYYTSPTCEGEYYTFEVPVNCLQYNCPEEAGWVDLEECGCIGIEIGSYVEGEYVWWNWGDGTESEGGHYAEHCYESDGIYIVEAWYSSPQCEGAWYTFEVEIDCSDDNCPDVFWTGEGEECGCWLFEIGSFVEGESVIWDFGDGTQEEGGHFADHCYEEDGLYIVTAFYTSPNCEGMYYTYTLEVNCEGECTDVGFAFDSFVENGGPNWIEWSVSTPDNWVIEDGGCEYSNSDAFCDALLCLEDGCYQVDIWSQTPLDGENAFFSGAFVDGEMLPIVDGPNYDGEYHMWYTFSLNGECEDPDCWIEIGYEQDGAEFVFEATPSDPEALVWWTLGDGTILSGDVIDHIYDEPGVYEVCAFFNSALCPGGVMECIEVVVTDDNCQLVIVSIEASFSSNSIDEFVWELILNDLGIEGGEFILFEGAIDLTFAWCLEDGCYTLNLDPDGLIGADYIIIQVWDMETEELLGEIEYANGDEGSQSMEFGVNTDCDVSVGEVEETSFTVYPVPTSDNLNIALTGYDGQVDLTLMDVTGKIIQTTNINSNFVSLDVSGLADGLYLISVLSERGVETRAIEILR